MSSAKRNFVLHGGILAIAGIIVRIIGMLYRIPMVNIIGSEGNGIYSVTFNVYNIMLVLSSYGLPIAVSKIVAKYVALNQYKNVKKTFACSLIFAVIAGGIAALLIFFGADFLEATIYSGYEGIAIPLKVLSPTIFIVAILGVFRGFFQGQGSMIPTAISQVVEQIINAIVSILASAVFVKSAADSVLWAAYGAAGGTLGTAMGALTALMVMAVLYFLYKPYFGKKLAKDMTDSEIEDRKLFKIIVMTMVPIILGQTFYQISATIDDIMYGNIMQSMGMESSLIKTTIGNFGSSYMILISLPMGVASAMSSSMLPTVVASYATNDNEGICNKIKVTMFSNMFVIIPSFVGLFILGTPIVKLIFPSYDAVQGGMMLKIGGISTIFYTLSTLSSSALQGIDKMRLPVRHSAISLGVHIVLTYVLLRFTSLGIYGLVIGNASFPILILILNLLALRKYVGYKLEIKNTFVIPAVCSAAMGAGCLATYEVMMDICKSNAISAIIAILIACIIYFGLMLVAKRKFIRL